MKRKGGFARIVFSDLPIKVICIAAAVILFFFHRINTLTERFFSVPLQVDVPAGLAIASSYPQSVRITLRGAEESIYPILEEDIEASVSLEGHKTPGVFRAPVHISRKATALNVQPLEVSVEPQEITFTLDALMERRVNVIADLRGSPAYGFELSQYSISPQSVVIRGARSSVQTVNALSTDEIDLTGRTGPFTLKVRISPPNPFLKVVGEASVEFKATIQETVLTKRFDEVPVETVDLSPHLALKAPLQAGSVQVKGPQISVEAFKPEQVKLIADCSTLRRPGSYILHVTPAASSEVVVLDWEPKDVTIDVIYSGR
jgi:YbbR domain-containing protein